MEENDTSSKKHKSKMEDEIMQWTPAVRAEATESKRLIDGMCRTRLSEKEKKAAERIAEQESRKEKQKSKKKSKTKKSKKGETKVTVKQHMKKQTHQTENTVMKAPTTTEKTETVSDETVIVQPITVEKKHDEFIKKEQEIEMKDSKKIKKKAKKRSKSKKSMRTTKSVEDTVAKEEEFSQIPETDIISPKITLDNEVTAINVDQLNMVPPIAEDDVEKRKLKDEIIREKKASKKIRKKSKKQSKSKRSKKTVEDTDAKEAESSQMPETDIISPKITLANEVTAINVDELNMVPPIAEEAVDKPVIKDEPQGERKDSKKIKKKSKKRSKSKKSKKSAEDTVAEEAAPSQMPETDIISPKLTLDNEATAINVDQLNMVSPIAEAAVEKPVIKDEPKGEKEASKKIKKKSKKRSKSKKSKKSVEHTVAKEAESSQMPETDIISPKPTLDNEVTAINIDHLNILPPIAEAAVEKPVIKDEPIGEKKASEKIKKKSKKRSKSKKSKKTVIDTVAKEAESSQMPKTDIISPKLTLDNEVTAINIDQLNMVPPIAEAAVEKPVIKDEPKGEKEASKKIKKKSKKRSKSKKSKKTVEDTVAKEAESSQMPETDIISPKLTLDNEATAINVDQLNMVPPIAEAAVEKPVIKNEPK
ncbi:hypothetical protein T05_9102, partial [Trichinella murrelli]